MKQAILSRFSGNFEPFYRKFLSKIEKIGGDEWRAICPFHDDTDPSLNINATTGQFFCHGCGKKGDIFHFYGKINGLATGRDFGKILNGICSDFGISKPAKPKSKITATYDYHSADGKMLYQVVRKEPGPNGKAKDFLQRRPGANGKWVWNLKGIEPVLYRLPDLLASDEILIVEGEKDCENLRSIGFTATTCSGGAGKWKDNYSDCLKGKNVVLIPDNDTPGKQHMTTIAQSLNGNAAVIKLLTIPGLPSKGDVSDFLTQFPDRDEAAERLALMIDSAPIYEPPKNYTIEDSIKNPGDFQIIETGNKKMFQYPWLKENSIGLISGWRGTGKSFLAMALLDAVSNGKPFGQWKCQTSAPCLYLDGEMTICDIQERLELLGIDSNRKKSFFIYSDAYANRLGLSRANLNSDTWRQSLKRILTTRGIKLWVIDNIASVCGGIDENSRQDWDPVNQWLLELRFAGVSTILLHHTGKTGAQRGTSAREDNLDYSITLKRPFDYVPEDGARFIVHFSKARVSTGGLKLIQDTEFKFTNEDSGNHVWTHTGVKEETRIQILEQLDEGLAQKEVAETLGISKGHVSKIRNKAIRDGFLTMKNKLTQDGFLMIRKDPK